MKINLSASRVFGKAASGAKADAPVASIPSATQAGVNTAVSRSGHISASGPGDFDAGKVERVRSAIDAGSYTVNPEAIADGMLADAHAFLASLKL